MRLYLLQYGLTIDHTPIPGYLIQTASGTNILVDTGFPAEAIGTQPALDMDLWVTPEGHVLQQLALIGLTTADIHYLVCSHFDFDHAGAHNLFTAAELVVQRQHYEFARSGVTDRFEDYRVYWDHPDLKYRLVDGDTILVPGVELIETSGHVPGHQSVLVRLLETGPVLLAIDALHQDPTTAVEPNPFDIDPPGAAASIRKLQTVIAREGVALTLFGHNSGQWATLRKAPDYYG